jgi:uncharacterized membrane protein YvlD (DUF360 family)
MLISLVLDLLVSAAVIRVVGGLSKTFEVEDWGPALLAALFLTAIAFFAPLGLLYDGLWAVVFGPTARETGVRSESAVAFQGILSFVMNTFLLFIVALVTPGIVVRGLFGVVLTATLLTIVELALPQLLARIGLLAG